MDLNATIVKTRALNGTITRAAGGGGTSDYEQLSNLPQINDVTLLGNKTSSDLGLAAAADIPAAGTATPKALGTAAVGTSTKYAREDHVHAKPTIPSASSTTPKMDGTAAVGTGTTYARADHVHPTDTSRAAASDLANKADKVTEVTNSTAGALGTVTLDPEKVYHFTGAITSVTIALASPASGQLAHYHFDFDSASTAPTVTIPNTVTMPGGFTVEASKHYEIDILNNYGAVISW